MLNRSPTGGLAAPDSPVDEPVDEAGYEALVRLVPHSGIQVLDFTLSTVDLAQTRLSFAEHRYVTSAGARSVLMPLDNASSSDGIVWHPVTHRALSPDECISLNGFAALEAFAGTWVPLPYLRYLGRDTAGAGLFDAGPENWARLFVAQPEGALRDADSVKLSVAFDTRLETTDRFGDRRYLVPNADDVMLGSTFKMATEASELSRFASAQWIDTWLRNAVDAFRSRSAATLLRPGFAFEHVARYLTLIDVLQRSCALPDIRFIDTMNRRWPTPVADVDLVLDIGTTETAALLVDAAGDRVQDSLATATAVAVRDLSDPTRVHRGAIPTRAEFAVPPFGDAGLSRLSGRADAFQWPSLVRIGREAERLALQATATPGITGRMALPTLMSETELSDDFWRVASDKADGGSIGPVASGLLMAQLAADGRPLASSGAGSLPAVRPRFAAASLMTFFVAELLLHVLSQVNAPARSGLSQRPGGVRRLKRLVLSAPAAMPEAEREALAGHAERAVELVWCAMGWDAGKDAAEVPRPVVSIGLGSDLAAHLFLVQQEIAGRFEDDAHALLALSGGDGAGRNVRAPAPVRVASVEFGTAGSSAVVMDYGVSSDGRFTPAAGVADRWQTGADAVVDALAERFVLPAISEALAKHGVPDAALFLCRVLDAVTDRPIRERGLARRLRSKVIRPAAEALLAIGADLPARIAVGHRQFSLGFLVGRGGGRLDPQARELEALVMRDGGAGGARDFTLESVAVRISQRQFDAVIRTVTRPMIERLADIAGRHDCDLVLVSGALAEIPCVVEELLSDVPLEPGRIVITRMSDTPAGSTGRERLSGLSAARWAGLAGAYAVGSTAAGIEPLSRVALQIAQDPMALAEDRVPSRAETAAGTALRSATIDAVALRLSGGVERTGGLEP